MGSKGKSRRIQYIIGYIISLISIIIGIILEIIRAPDILDKSFNFIEFLSTLPISLGCFSWALLTFFFSLEDYSLRAKLFAFVVALTIESLVISVGLMMLNLSFLVIIAGTIGLTILVTILIIYQLTYVKKKFENSKIIKKEKRSYKDISYLGKAKQKLQITFYRSTRILPYYYIILIISLNVPILIIFGIISVYTKFAGLFLIGVVIVGIITISFFILAIIQAWIRKQASNEFVFDKNKNLFTISKINSKNKRKLKREIPLSDIKQLILKEVVWRNPTKFSTYYYLNLKLINNYRIKLYKTIRLYEIEEYAKKLAKFLGLKINYTTTKYGYITGL
ncbi:MAG: hypothetical protein ACFFDN_34170 [Candidatus Hodarchaeota archaeon]